MAGYLVYSGTVGWDAEVLKNVYPEDLPKDWKLSFYNTQFRCVFLPLESWSLANEQQIQIWLNDTQEGFRFLLGGAIDENAGLMRKAACFGAKGVLEHEAQIVWLDGKVDMRALAARMQALSGHGQPLFVIARGIGSAELAQLNELISILGM